MVENNRTKAGKAERKLSMNGITINAQGSISVEQNRLNLLLAEAFPVDPAVSCICEAGNRLKISIRSKSKGTVRLTVRVIDFKHGLRISTVSFQLLERRSEGNPLKALLLENMPYKALTFLLKMFALPSTIQVDNAGDEYTVDFHAWLVKSPLAEKAIMGVKVVDSIQITGMEVDAGRICIQGGIDFKG